MTLLIGRCTVALLFIALVSPFSPALPAGSSKPVPEYKPGGTGTKPLGYGG